MVREPVHVVDLRGEKQLAHVRKHGIRYGNTRPVDMTVGGRRHAAREEPFDDLDQLDHRLLQVARAIQVDAVGLGHQRSGTDEQVPEARARRNTGVAMVRRVVVGESP